MQISETVNEHLRREFRITVAKTDLDARLSSRLEGMKGQVNLKGFRPGKVPVAHLRKTYGNETLNEAVSMLLVCIFMVNVVTISVCC